MDGPEGRIDKGDVGYGDSTCRQNLDQTASSMRQRSVPSKGPPLPPLPIDRPILPCHQDHQILLKERGDRDLPGHRLDSTVPDPIQC